MADLKSKVELARQSFEQLGVEADDDGTLYLPVELRARAADGGVKVLAKALLKLPTNRQAFKARTESRALGLKHNLDLDRDKLQFDQLENYALLTYALRDPKTKGQLEPTVEDLLERFNDATLSEVWGKLNEWRDVQDPRYGDISTEQLWQVIAAVAVGGASLPLSGLPTFVQGTCITLMAREALLSPNAPSWLVSPSTSASASSADARSPSSSGASTPTADPSIAE